MLKMNFLKRYLLYSEKELVVTTVIAFQKSIIMASGQMLNHYWFLKCAEKNMTTETHLAMFSLHLI